MSDTPITESYIKELHKKHFDNDFDDLSHYMDMTGSMAEKCRELEVKLAAMTAERDELRKERQASDELTRFMLNERDRLEIKCAELRQLLTNKCNADAALWALSIDASNHEHQVALEKCHAADEEIYAAMGEKP